MDKFVLWKIRRLFHQIGRQGVRVTSQDLLNKIKERKAMRVINRDPVLAKKQFQDIWQLAQSPDSQTFRVLLVVLSYYDLPGDTFQHGGAERYTLKLSNLVNKLGGRLEVYQCGDKNWHHRADGIDFFGLATGGYDTEALNRHFHEWVPQGRLTIYYQMRLSAPLCHTPSICVSHGVDWDAHWLQNQPNRYKQTIKTILSSVLNTTYLVSVDTNTINWLRASDATLAQKCIYIPNFVDIDEYHPSETPHSGFIVLYPRRLSEARGFWLLAQLMPKLLESYPDIIVHFCGIAEHLEEIEVRHLGECYPGRVVWDDKLPGDMPGVYAEADLVVIPTCYSEGTSLACLEAQASEKPVIASNVGGLPDLIINGFNGILVDPKEEDLYQAMIDLYDHSDKRLQLAKNGRKTAELFSETIWIERWRVVLDKALGITSVK